MAYAKLYSTITESSLWSAGKDARLLFLSMLAKADQIGFIEAALPGLARLANLSLSETEAALAELMAPDPYSKSPDCDGARVIKVERGWCLVNYEAYRDRRDDDQKREYMRNYMRQRRSGNNGVNFCKDSLNNVGQAEASTEASTEREGEALLSKDEKTRAFFEDMGVKTKKGGDDLLLEWKAVCKGLKQSVVERIFKEAKPGIQWPSEFKNYRKDNRI